MKLLINGKEEPLVFIGKTLGDFIVHVEQGGMAQGNVVRSVKLNGQESSPDSPVTQQTPLSDIETLEMEVSTLSGIIDKNIENADAYLMRLIPGIEKSVELFRTGNEQEANQFFINIIDCFVKFCFPKMRKTFVFSNVKIITTIPNLDNLDSK